MEENLIRFFVFLLPMNASKLCINYMYAWISGKISFVNVCVCVCVVSEERWKCKNTLWDDNNDLYNYVVICITYHVQCNRLVLM